MTNDDNGQENIWMVAASKYFNKKLVKPSFHLDEALGISREEVYQFFAEKGWGILAEIPIRDHCLDTLSSLRDNGCEIHLITARHPRFHQITLEWLAQHQVPYDSLSMNPLGDAPFSKGKKCVELNVEFFVDDNYENCVDTHQAGVHTLLFHTTHNKDKNPPVPRVYDWPQIAEEIAEFLKWPTYKRA